MPEREVQGGTGETLADGPFWAADGRFRQLDPNYVLVSQLGSWVFNAFVALGLAIALTMAIGLGWLTGWSLAAAVAAAMLVLILLSWLAVVLPRWEYACTRYAVSEQGIEIHRGIFWRHVIHVPRSRMQHTDVGQGPLQRQFGLARLEVYTAGTSHNMIQLEGLSHPVAMQIRNYLVGEGDVASEPARDRPATGAEEDPGREPWRERGLEEQEEQERDR